MNKAYLLTGGNLGERKENLRNARVQIALHCGDIVKSSSIYETAAWGKTDQPTFLNQVLELATVLNAEQLMKEILEIEKRLGRIRQEKYGPRIIDIDMLLFNNEIIDSSFLKLPHPEIQNRRFALIPLSEIAPNEIHPVFKKTIAELLKECPDQLEVKKYS